MEFDRLVDEAAGELARPDGDVARAKELLAAAHTAEAVRALAAGDVDGAIEHAHRALDFVPGHEPAVRALVEAQIAAQRWEDALFCLRSLAPHDAEGKPRGEFRSLFESAGRARRAELEHEAAEEPDAGIASVLRERAAKLAEEVGDTQVALALYTQLITWDGASALFERACLLMRLGEHARALTDFRRHIGSGLASDHALRTFLVSSLASASPEEKQADLALALNHMPEPDRAWFEARQEASGEQAVEALAAYCSLLRHLPDLDRVPGAPTELGIEPGQSLCSYAEMLVNTGFSALERGDAAKAGERAKAALSACPSDFHATRLLARAMALGGEPVRALGLLREALASAPELQAQAVADLRTIASPAAADLARVLAAEPPANADELRARLEEVVALRVLAGESELALAAADELVARVAGPDARLVRAQLHDLLGQRELAVVDYRAGVESSRATSADWRLLLCLEDEGEDHEGLAADSARMLAHWPDDMLARRLRSEALVALDRAAVALEELEAERRRAPADPWPRLRTLEILQETGAVERLRQEALSCIRQHEPGFVGAARILLAQSLDSGQLDQLGAEVQAVLKWKDDVAAALLQAMFCWGRREHENALYYIDFLRGALSDAPEPVALKAEVLAHDQRAQEALAVLEQLPAGALADFWADRIASTVTREENTADVACRPHVLALLEHLAVACPTSREVTSHLMARLAFYRMDLEWTLAWRRQQAELAERRASADALFEQALAAERSGALTEAVAGYQQALALDSEHGRAALRLAVHLLVEGNTTGAREVVRAAELTPKHESDSLDEALLAHVNEARLDAFQFGAAPMAWNDAVICVLGLYRALSLAERASELLADLLVAPDDVQMLERRARAALDCGAHAIGLADAQRCVELRPKVARLHLLIVEAHIQRSEWTEAQRALDQAIVQLPDAAELYLERADLRYTDWTNGKDPASALGALADARRANDLQNSHDALWLQAVALDALGQWQEAFEVVDRMYRLYPDEALPQLQHSAELRVEDFHEQLREAVARGAAEHEAALARQREAQLAAEAEAARQAAEIAESERRRKEESLLAQQTEAILARILERGSMWSDPQFNALVEANRAAGAELERRMANDAARFTRLHELERRFGFYSQAAEAERRRGD